MKRSTTPILIAACVALAAALVPAVRAHCQIPCGIFDDHLRFHLMEEHIHTIEKSMQQVTAAGSAIDNQAVRWILNKEDHADAFAEIVTAYFLAQRVKPEESDRAAYARKLELLHALLVDAMKAKQSTDAAVVARLRTNLAAFRIAYEGPAPTTPAP